MKHITALSVWIGVPGATWTAILAAIGAPTQYMWWLWAIIVPVGLCAYAIFAINAPDTPKIYKEHTNVDGL